MFFVFYLLYLGKGEESMPPPTADLWDWWNWLFHLNCYKLTPAGKNIRKEMPGNHCSYEEELGIMVSAWKGMKNRYETR